MEGRTSCRTHLWDNEWMFEDSLVLAWYIGISSEGLYEDGGFMDIFGKI